MPTWILQIKKFHSRFRTIETLAITIVPIALGLWLRPADPFFLQTTFPWLLLVPLLSGLYHGFVYGLGAGLMLLFAIFGFNSFEHTASVALPLQTGAGFLLVGMLAGECADRWFRTTDKIKEEARLLSTQLDELTRSLYLLKRSHDRLEHQLTGADSLRGALADLRKIPSESKKPRLEDLSPPVLQLLANHCTVRAASVHAADEHGQIDSTPLAQLGSHGPLNLKDPLLVRSLKTRQLASVVPSKEIRERAESAILAIIPLEDIHGKLWGVIAVYAMPFIAFEQEHLRLLAVIGAHMADMLGLSTQALHDEMKGTPQELFKAKLSRCVEDARRFDIAAIVLGISYGPRAQSAGVVEIIQHASHDVDQHWLIAANDSSPVSLIVMPFTDKSALWGYKQRIADILEQKLQLKLNELDITFHSSEVDGSQSTEEMISKLMARCDVEAHQQS